MKRKRGNFLAKFNTADESKIKAHQAHRKLRLGFSSFVSVLIQRKGLSRCCVTGPLMQCRFSIFPFRAGKKEGGKNSGALFCRLLLRVHRVKEPFGRRKERPFLSFLFSRYQSEGISSAGGNLDLLFNMRKRESL